MVSEALLELVRSTNDRPLTMRSFATMVLLKGQGPMLFSDLRDRLGLSKSTAFRIVERLTEDGMVRQDHVLKEDDARLRMVVDLLPEGESCVEVFTSRIQHAPPG